MIEIDGSFGEGGGQILRTALSLAVINQTPCHIFNIRKKRKRPGLKPQHLAGLAAINELCNGKIKGAKKGSSEIRFCPGKIKNTALSIDIPTAGSITLVLQVLIPPALFGERPLQVSFRGGATDTFFSPTLDHFQRVFLKILKRMGGQIKIKVERRGFYPKGGAKMTAEVLPSKLRPLQLTSPGGLERVLILSGATKDLEKKRVAERQISGVKQVLGKLNLPLQEEVSYYPSQSTGSVVNIIAKLENTALGADNLGKLGRSAEEVGKGAALKFLKEVKSDACLDRWAADQILPYIALAGKKSRVSVSKITGHCRTNMHVIKKFLLGEFQAERGLITFNCKRPIRD